ncbi:MAG TPA: M56 family metallopeptidase, partial [Candidatus Limnocylindrales bacterium]|nr:M56 family metallopeptidase [Candidatus Limnocylindrales bacterium]
MRALILLGYALFAATAGARTLRRCNWPHVTPRLGVLAWQALSGSVLLATLLAGAALSLPEVEAGRDLASLLHACALALRAQYATPAGALLSAAGVGLIVTVLGRLAWCLCRELLVARHARQVRLDALRLVAQRDERLGFLVLEHTVPSAYCLPGRRREVVLTSGALQVLDAEELTAVLAHEEAHLRGNHHLVIAAARGLRRAFPFVPLFRWAAQDVAELLEMLADDEASRRSGRLVVATALVRLAEGKVPAGALGAKG